MFVWLVRLLVLMLIVRIVLSVVRGRFRGLGSARRDAVSVSGVKLVRDPVCGTFVDPSRALAASAHGATYYFCSDRCQQTFAREGVPRRGAARRA